MPPLEIFFSYAHKDEILVTELEKQLSLLRNQGLISNWTDRKIMSGQNFVDAIDTHINTSAIILLLISSDFMASDYCYGIEMKRAMERHNHGDAVVIPIILRQTDWKQAPFGQLQALPKDGKPVKSFGDQDEAFYEVAIGIRAVVESIDAQKQQLAQQLAQLKATPFKDGTNPFDVFKDG